MNDFAAAMRVADAVLYEGYALYPYRPSTVKNQSRWQFGVIVPRTYSEDGWGEPWAAQTEVLIDPAGDPTLDVRIRCLHIVARTVEAVDCPNGAFRPVDALEVNGRPAGAWEEGEERQIDYPEIPVTNGLRVSYDVELQGGCDAEPVRSASGTETGRMVRTRLPVSGVVEISADSVGSFLKVRVRIENHTRWPAHIPFHRSEALRQSLVSAHVLLAVRQGAFISLLDPPPGAKHAAASCANLHTWPILVGAEGSRNVMLSSPIILYDYPQIAPESPGDLFDATEIDELLTLRILTLTDDEQREAMGTDDRVRRILERSHGIPQEFIERMHGAIRSIGPVPRHAGAGGPLEGPPVRDGDGSRVAARLESTPLEHVERSPAETRDDGEPRGCGGRPPAAEGPNERAESVTVLNAADPWNFGDPGVAPEDASVMVGAWCVSRGSRVRLRPVRQADAMDLFLAGRTARVASVLRDIDGVAYVAVTLDDDPGADLHEWIGRFYYFYPDEIEPL